MVGVVLVVVVLISVCMPVVFVFLFNCLGMFCCSYFVLAKQCFGSLFGCFTGLVTCCGLCRCMRGWGPRWSEKEEGKLERERERSPRRRVSERVIEDVDDDEFEEVLLRRRKPRKE